MARSPKKKRPTFYVEIALLVIIGLMLLQRIVDSLDQLMDKIM
jgi:hypothetical protein